MSSSWSDLPFDIIKTITELLHYSDIIRFSAVCKSWWQVTNTYGVKSADKLPWIFGYDESSDSHGSFYLYDPFYRKQHTINKPPFLASAQILASKDGWILFFKQPSSIFFYSPFSNKIIELPPLIIRFHDKAIFTASPGSSHCMVFVVSTDANCICITKYSQGDSQWTQQYYNCAYSDLHGIAQNNGVIYLAFSHLLCAFTHEKRDWKIIYLQNPIWRNQRFYSNDSSLIESDGNLFLVYYNGNGGYYETGKYPNACNVLRFDLHRNEWLGVEDLGKNMLFLGYDSHSSMLLPAIGEIRELANTVHFGGDTKDRYVCYSYGFDTLQPADRNVFNDVMMIKGLLFLWFEGKERRSSYPQPYGWIKEQRSSNKNIFLQPPQLEIKLDD